MADLSLTATSVDLVSGPTSTDDAGETIIAGQVLYKSSSDSLLYKADATDASKDDVIGIALNGGAINQPIVYAKNGAVVTIGVATVVTETYILSTAGLIAPIADLASSDYLTRLGTGITTANIQLQFYTSSLQKA